MAGFHEGRIWIEQPVGSRRPGIFVGDAQNASWFGGQAGAHVAYPDARSGDQVSSIRNAARG